MKATMVLLVLLVPSLLLGCMSEPDEHCFGDADIVVPDPVAEPSAMAAGVRLIEEQVDCPTTTVRILSRTSTLTLCTPSEPARAGLKRVRAAAKAAAQAAAASRTSMDCPARVEPAKSTFRVTADRVEKLAESKEAHNVGVVCDLSASGPGRCSPALLLRVFDAWASRAVAPGSRFLVVSPTRRGARVMFGKETPQGTLATRELSLLRARESLVAADLVSKDAGSAILAAIMVVQAELRRAELIVASDLLEVTAGIDLEKRVGHLKPVSFAEPLSRIDLCGFGGDAATRSDPRAVDGIVSEWKAALKGATRDLRLTPSCQSLRVELLGSR